MTVAEAARLLKLTKGRIRQLLIARQLKGERITPTLPGGDDAGMAIWVIPMPEIERYAALKASGEVHPGRPRKDPPA